MHFTARPPRSVTVCFLFAALLVGCGGTRVLKDPQPIQTTQPIAGAADERVTVALDWVIVRDGPGTWAKNADWDEYLLRVGNSSNDQIQLTGLIVVDSLDTPNEALSGRKKLVKGSKMTARRYSKSGIKVKAGRGAGTMLVAGAAVTAVGVGVAQAAVYGSIMSGAATTGSAGAAAGGLLLLGPALAVGGIVRGINNSKVNDQIGQRQTPLPLAIPATEERALNVFFPITPSPKKMQLAYTDAAGAHSLVIDTRAALDGLHLDTPASD